MSETKRMIVTITVPASSVGGSEEVYDEIETAIREVADYYDALVEIQ